MENSRSLFNKCWPIKWLKRTDALQVVSNAGGSYQVRQMAQLQGLKETQARQLL